MSAFALPTHSLLEATEPPERRGVARDEVRLLVTDRAAGTHMHARFLDIASFLRAGDLLVVNDSATLPAAQPALRADGSKITLHLSTQIDSRIWMTEPRGTVLCGEELELPGGGSAVTIAPVEPEAPRLWYTWFQLPLTMHEYLARFGEPIRYGYITQRFPLGDYQTIFAREPGSSEMPSAARPFSRRILRALEAHDVEIAVITLHCGVASFEEPERPATERYAVPQATADAVNAARKARRRVIAVGTTVVRALESSVLDRVLVASRGWTDLVIGEHHLMQMVDGLLTGFHSVTSTHQAMLRAFVEPRLLAQAYDVAEEQGYYCHEFGDVHLIV
jgi:S-adenosylmethionine:tRNA ribosyltransferase-isomerase